MRSRGFTLIELLVVISIIGILSSFALASFSQAQKSARDGKRKADLQQVASALEIYRADKGTYPVSDYWTGFNIPGCGIPCGTVECLWGGTWACGGSTYMQTLPKDPKGIDYYYSGYGNIYTLQACLENTGDLQGEWPPPLGWPGYCVSSKVFVVKNPQ